MIARRSRLLGLLAVLTVATPLLLTSPAHAAGTITPSKSELEDSGSGWKLFVTIKLGKKPATAHQPMRFIFTPQVLYETFLDDTKPGEQTRMLPQDKNVTPIVETLDVSFGDVQGNLWDTTKFDFVIRRDHDFQAGEYKVEVRDGDDRTVGQPFKLKLAGKNQVIDRRAMVFAGGDKKKKEGPSDKPADAKPADPSPTKTEPETTTTATPVKDPDAAAAPPPEVKPKQGGCGCQLPGDPAPEGLGAVAIAAVALGSLRRRRRD